MSGVEDSQAPKTSLLARVYPCGSPYLFPDQALAGVLEIRHQYCFQFAVIKQRKRPPLVLNKRKLRTA